MYIIHILLMITIIIIIIVIISLYSQGHTASKWESWDFKPSSLAIECVPLVTLLYKETISTLRSDFTHMFEG